VAWKDVAVPKHYPDEFRDDVVRSRGIASWVWIAQIATDFGVHPMTLQKRLHRAVIEDGVKSGQTRLGGVPEPALIAGAPHVWG
jgi:transposase